MSRSFKRRARPLMSAMLLMLPVVSLSACAGQPPIYLAANPCYKLIPESWKSGVQSAPLPADKSVGEWVSFGDAQTGELDVANSHFTDALTIIENCEARDQAVADNLKPKPWWHIW